MGIVKCEKELNGAIRSALEAKIAGEETAKISGDETAKVGALAQKCQTIDAEVVTEMKRVEVYEGAEDFQAASIANYDLIAQSYGLLQTELQIDDPLDAIEMRRKRQVLQKKIEDSSLKVSAAQSVFASSRGISLETNAYELEQDRQGNR